MQRHQAMARQPPPPPPQNYTHTGPRRRILHAEAPGNGLIASPPPLPRTQLYTHTSIAGTGPRRRILHAEAPGDGLVAAQAPARLGAVPLEVLVLAAAQHPLAGQRELHRHHPALVS